MLNLLDLVELQDFRYPALAFDQPTFRANFTYLMAKGIQVDWDIVSAREDIS